MCYNELICNGKLVCRSMLLLGHLGSMARLNPVFSMAKNAIYISYDRPSPEKDWLFGVTVWEPNRGTRVKRKIRPAVI